MSSRVTCLLSPIRVFLPDSGSGKLPGEQPHLKRQEQALLSTHRPLNLELNGVRLR